MENYFLRFQTFIPSFSFCFIVYVPCCLKLNSQTSLQIQLVFVISRDRLRKQKRRTKWGRLGGGKGNEEQTASVLDLLQTTKPLFYLILFVILHQKIPLLVYLMYTHVYIYTYMYICMYIYKTCNLDVFIFLLRADPETSLIL